MTYVNTYVASVPSKERKTFVEKATPMDVYFKEKGALRVVECWGVDVPDGKLTSLPLAVKAEKDETVVFGWIEWNSREESDAAMQAMMNEPKFSPENNPMPFDGKRMIFGGFEIVVDM